MLFSSERGFFLALLDLGIVYFQVPIRPSSRMLLGIHVRESYLYFPPLVFFGLSTALQPFTRVFAVVSAWARSPEICLLGYRDNCFFLASLEREAKQTVQSLSSDCHFRGIVITKEELGIVSSQTVKCFGMTVDTVADLVFPSLTRVVNFMSVVKSFLAMARL